MESLLFVGTDGSSVDLTDYAGGDIVVSARRGFSGPPVQPVTESIPNVAGSRYIGTLTKERTLDLTIRLTADNWEDALDAIHDLAVIMSQSGYFESTANSNVRRIDVVYAGGLEGDSASREGARFTFVVRYVAPNPYWYDPTEDLEQIDMAEVEAGVAFPLVFPIYFNVAGAAAAFNVEAGTAPSDWRATLIGPANGVTLKRLSSNETLAVQNVSVGSGHTLIIDARSGRHRIVLDDGVNQQNVSAHFSDDSWYWLLQPGTNRLAVEVDDGPTAILNFRFYRRFLAPG